MTSPRRSSGFVRVLSRTRSQPSPGGEPVRRSAGRSWLVEHAWLVALALVVPLGTGGIALFEHFDGLYGQDSFAYFDYAVGPMRHSLLDLHGPPPFFWPPGYPFAVALVSLVVGAVPLAGQLVSLTAGALVGVFTALLAREVWPGGNDGTREPRKLFGLPAVPFVAGLLAALTGQLWQSSVVVMSDTLGLAAATAGVWALARYGRKHDLRWLVAAGALLAGATFTRWIYGVVAVPCAAYALLVGFRQRRPVAPVRAGVVLVVAGVLLTPAVLGMLDRLFGVNWGLDPFTGNFEVYHWSPARIFDREFTTADGRLVYPHPTGLYYAEAPFRWAFFTPILAPLILPGIWAAVRSRAAAPLLLLLGWAAFVYAFHAGAAYQNFRFTLAYLPPLAILAAVGAQQVARWLLRVHQVRLRRMAIGLAAGVVALGVVVMVAAAAHTTRNFIAIKNDSVAIVRWTEARVPANAQLVTFNLTSTFRRYSGLETFELYEQDPASLRALLASRRPAFLLVDVASLQGQWRGRSPGRDFRWLERRPGLTAIGERANFTLFRIGAGGG